VLCLLEQAGSHEVEALHAEEVLLSKRICWICNAGGVPYRNRVHVNLFAVGTLSKV
jgi:hypothetical protein